MPLGHSSLPRRDLVIVRPSRTTFRPFTSARQRLHLVSDNNATHARRQYPMYLARTDPKNPVRHIFRKWRQGGCPEAVSIGDYPRDDKVSYTEYLEVLQDALPLAFRFSPRRPSRPGPYCVENSGPSFDTCLWARGIPTKTISVTYCIR